MVGMPRVVRLNTSASFRSVWLLFTESNRGMSWLLTKLTSWLL